MPSSVEDAADDEQVATNEPDANVETNANVEETNANVETNAASEKQKKKNVGNGWWVVAHKKALARIGVPA